VGMLADGQAALIARQQAAAGAPLTYARGAQTLAVTGWAGRQVYSSQLEGGRRLEYGERDYLVAVADLVALGDPAIGDRITETINGAAVVFEVATPTNGEPHARYSDQTRLLWRIHVKQV